MEPKIDQQRNKPNRPSVFFAPTEVNADEEKKQIDPAAQVNKNFLELMKMKRVGSIHFIRRESEPLESRIYRPSCFKKAWRAVSGMIEPRDVSTEESFAYHTRSMMLHVLHFILVFWVIYGFFDLDKNYDSAILTDLITKSYFESEFIPKSLQFRDIYSPIHIWEFVRGVILKIIYPVETTNSTHNSIWGSNIMIGVPQIRQVRVKRDTCVSAPLFTWLYKHCYGYFNEENEDRETFGPKTSPPWRYSFDREKEVLGFFYIYSGNGFAMNFSQNYNATVLQLKELEDNQWIRQGTRAVFLDFSIYCHDTNVYYVVKIVFEMMPWGGVYPFLNIYPVKLLLSWNSANDFLQLGLQIVLFCYTVGLNYGLYLRIRYGGVKEVLNLQFINDTAIITSTYMALGIHAALAVITRQRVQGLVDMVHKSEHPTFGVFIRIYRMYFDTTAVLLMCIMLKFSIFSFYFNRSARFFGSVVKVIWGELLCFTLINVIVLTGVSLFLPAVFGQIITGMSSPLNAVIHTTLYHVRSFSGRFTLKLQVPGPGYYLAQISLPAVFFYINCISIPTYTALIVYGWGRAPILYPRDPLQITASEVFWTRIRYYLEICKLHKLANKLQELYIIKLNEEDYYPVTEILRRHGWTPLEIRLLLKKYGIRKGDDLTIDEISELYEDFWVRNSLFFEVSGHEEMKRDLEHIDRNMKNCDSAIADLKSKVERLTDIVLEQKSIPRVDSSRKSMIGRLRN